MEKLESPFELLELEDGEDITIKILKYDEGTMIIHPEYKPEGKEINALRVHVSKEDKVLFPHYWDITAVTLVAQVLPILKNGNYQDKRFKIKKYGRAPRARFSVEVF